MAQNEPIGVRTLLNAAIVVEKKLGEGGQGCVYSVLYNGEKKAMKIYKPKSLHDPKMFYENLVNNVKRGSPSPAFLWPQDVIKPYKNSEGETTFGYIMDLRKADYQEMSVFLNGSVRFASYRNATDAALQITSAFRALHSMGYSYQDLNDGNFFIDPKTGEVLICDNDNVAPNGTKTGILGKPRYMAPEIARGDAMPNTQTDRFSLAVIIFLLLTLSHPLEGKRFLVPCLTPDIEKRIYGTEPIFICDPADRRNAPVRGIHNNIGIMWPALPDYLREAFTQAFSRELLFTPDRRFTEQNWEALLIRFRSDILPCACGEETFVWDHAAPVCGGCGRKMMAPSMMELGGCDYQLPLLPGSVVFRSQFGTANVDVAGRRVLHVVVNPKDRTLHLHNVSGDSVECITPSGKRIDIAPGKTAPVKPGLSFRLDGDTKKMVRIL